MPVISISQLVNGLRVRTQMSRQMLKFCKKQMNNSTRHRLEKGVTRPKQKNFEAYMKDIDFPLEGFVYPLLENYSAKVLIMCDHLNQALNIKDMPLAQTLFEELSSLMNAEDEISRQFLLSKEARLCLYSGESPSHIYDLIYKGFKITYENFNESELSEKTLVLEEPELVHTLARTKASDGKLDEAIKILTTMKENLKNLPNSDKEKERQLTPVLLSLSEYQLQMRDYDNALDTCDLGAKSSADYIQGQINPEFEYYIALALYELGLKEKCRSHLYHAYIGRILLGEMKGSKNLQIEAEEKFGIPLNLYGVDELKWKAPLRSIYNRGEHIDGGHVGVLIRNLRDLNELSGNTLAQGICNGSTLSKIETVNEMINYDIYFLESLMQRLGRSIHLYNNFFLGKEFVSLKLRDKVSLLLTQKKTEEAVKYLSKLESISHFFKHHHKKYRMNKQFVDMAKLCILMDTHKSSDPNLPDKLKDAIKITYPRFDERDIDRHPMAYTYNELFLINQLANHFSVIGNLHRAMDIYEQVRQNLNNKYVDEVEKARMYSTILFNYSTCLGKSGHYEKAFKIIEEAELFERSHGRLTNLPKLIFNKGYNMLMLGAEAKDIIPNFVLAYYGCSMFAKYGLTNDMLIIRKFIKEHFGFSLN